MHPHIRTPPYRPPAFAPCADPDAPIQLPVDLSAARLADELHAQLARPASGCDLRVLRRQARDAFRPVHAGRDRSARLEEDDPMQPHADDAPISGASYLIPVDNVPALVRHARGLLERARKPDVDCALQCRIEPQPQVLRDGDLLQWVTVLVRPPRAAGWSLAARYDVDPFGMAATIPHAVPGVELPRRYWTLGDPVCEHCHTVRDRRAVFLLAHADGRHILVGRSCLRAFLDCPDPERIAALFDALVPDGIVAHHLYRDPGSPNSGGGYLNALEELAWTAAIVGRHGWRSVAKADDEHTATASRLAFLMNRPHPKLASLWHAERAACEPAEEHRATARRTVALVRAAPADSEYLVKLKALAGAAAIHVRDRALWCSAITLDIRRRAKQREREAAARRRSS